MTTKVNNIYRYYNDNFSDTMPHNAAIFKNTGSVTVTINQFIRLAPGESYGYGHNANEENMDRIQIDVNTTGQVLAIYTIYE